MSYSAAPLSTHGQEMSVMPEIGSAGGKDATASPGYSASLDEDKKDSQDPLDPESFKRGSGSSNDDDDNRANLDDKAAEIAEYQKKLPKLDFKNGAGAFFSSAKLRLRAVFTPRFLLCLVAGQLLSLCITCTSVVTTELGIGEWSLPATQTFFVYFALMSIYTPLTLYKYGVAAWAGMLKTDGWKYAILGTIDVFGNFATVFGFRYTNLLSCLLLGAWATPVSMVVTFFLCKARYHWTQLLGVCICLAGLGVLVASDMRTSKDWGYTNKVKGDLFILLGATLYGLSNGIEEFLVRGRPHYEVVGALGLVGFIVNGILVGGYEHASVYGANWSGRNVGLLFAYISAMVILYSVAPLLFRYASAPFYNLSLMTSDFFSLLFGLFLFKYKPYFLYFIAYPMVVIGLITYAVGKPLEAQADAKIAVMARGQQAEKEARTGKSRVIGQPKGKLGSIL